MSTHRKIDPADRDLAERLWRGAMRWADRSIRPRFIALVTEWMSSAPLPDHQDEELTPRDEERVEAALERLERRQKRPAGR